MGRGTIGVDARVVDWDGADAWAVIRQHYPRVHTLTAPTYDPRRRAYIVAVSHESLDDVPRGEPLPYIETLPRVER